MEGDLHELIPGKLIAFRGPRFLSPPNLYQDRDGIRTFSPAFYIEPFADMNVSTVVRLNEPEYDGEEFEAHGIEMVELEFEDCTAPSPDIVSAFLDAVQKAQGAVAVH